jgi:hypothetical protein
MTSVLAHLPWFLAALDMAIEARAPARRWFACAAIALVTGSQVLEGFPQALWFSLLSGATFALCMLVMRRSPWQSWLAVAGGVLLGMCMGAAELLSMYSMFVTSTRVVEDPSLMPYPALDPSSFRDLFVPCRTEYAWSQTYFGAAPLVLVLWWLTAWRTRPTPSPGAPAGAPAMLQEENGHRQTRVRQLTRWALLLATVTALLSMGLTAKLYYLQLWLPVVGSFRAPARIFLVTQFCAGILSGVALDHLVGSSEPRVGPWRHLVLPWAGVVVAIVLAVWFAAQPESQATHAVGFRGRAGVGRRIGLGADARGSRSQHWTDPADSPDDWGPGALLRRQPRWPPPLARSADVRAIRCAVLRSAHGIGGASPVR